jgi:hypothetical protein
VNKEYMMSTNGATQYYYRTSSLYGNLNTSHMSQASRVVKSRKGGGGKRSTIVSQKGGGPRQGMMGEGAVIIEASQVQEDGKE